MWELCPFLPKIRLLIEFSATWIVTYGLLTAPVAWQSVTPAFFGAAADGAAPAPAADSTMMVPAAAVMPATASMVRRALPGGGQVVLIRRRAGTPRSSLIEIPRSVRGLTPHVPRLTAIGRSQ